MLLRGVNKLWRLIPVKRSGNIVTVDSTNIYVQPDAVHPFIGGTPIIVTHTLDAGELTPEFIYYSNKFANDSGRAVSLVEVVQRLKDMDKSVSLVVDIVNRFRNKKIGLDAAVSEYSHAFNMPDYNRGKVTNMITKAASSVDGTKPYLEELRQITKALKITTGLSRAWKTENDENGNVVRVFSQELLSSDELIDLAPVGNGIDDLETVIRRNEVAAVKDTEFNPSQGIKYIVVGVVVFIVMLGVRVVFLGH
jgi:hypothetical protein